MKRILTLGLAALLLSGTVGCLGPVKVEKLVRVGPSHTAFRLPLEDTNEGQPFMSVEYLKKKKVQSQQYSIPQRQRNTGRWWWQYDYIPTELVVVVDRAPVTRAFSYDATGQGDHAIRLESVESIGFMLGITLTCSVEEDDAPLYLYNFGGYTFNEKQELVPYKPEGGEAQDPSLGHVMDTNIKSWIQQKLSHDLGAIHVDEMDQKVGQAIDACFKEAKEVFKKQGITVQSMGLAAGMRFDNVEIQKVVDKRFTATNDIEIAKQEAAGQRALNARFLAKVKNDIETANKRVAAKDAVLLQAQLKLAMLDAETFKIAAQGWDGKPTQLAPQGALFLFGLDGMGAPKIDILPTPRPAQPADKK